MALGKRLDAIEEVALPLNGKKRELTRELWVAYFGRDRLSLPEKVVDKVLNDIGAAADRWRTRIEESFLPHEHKELYNNLLTHRLTTLHLL